MTLRTKTLTAVAALTIFAGGYALAQDAATTEQPAEAQLPAAESDTSTEAPAEANSTDAGDAEGGSAAEPATDIDAAGAEAPVADEPAAQEAPADAEATQSEPDAEPSQPAADAPAAEETTTEPAPAEAESAEEPADAAPAADEAPVTSPETEAPAAEEPAEQEAPAEAEATQSEPAAEPSQPAAAAPAAEEPTTEPAPAEAEPAEEPADAAPAAEETPSEAEATESEPAEPAQAGASEGAQAQDPAAEAPVEENASAEEEAVDEAAAPAAEEHAEAGDSHEGHVEDVSFSFEGPFGNYDQFQLQRGLQVYTEVCAACHGMKFVPIRSLSEDGGPGLPEDQVREYAKQFTVIDELTGEERPGLPTDNFPANTSVGAPDLSLMAKARAGFHGPYGTGLSQLVNGIGGPEYIHAVLTGYTGEEVEQPGSVLYENTAFAGGVISMAPPLSDDLVTYEDGTPATVDQMARDVSAFLMWTAEPKLSARKQVGFVSVLFLILFASLLYLTNKRLWAPHKGKHQDQ